MAYVEQNLIPGETVLYRTGLHWITLAGPVFAALLFGLPGLLMLIAGAAGGSGGVAFFGLLLLAFGGFLVAVGIWKRNATEMAVTNKRIVIKTGLLSRRTFELLLTKVESIGVDEPVVGRMFGYGSVVVRGTGGSPEPFPRVRQPLEFRRQVQQRIDASSPNRTSDELVRA
jgi:uncharacterized membrane protein YdbT with pleckstrin-like domain